MKKLMIAVLCLLTLAACKQNGNNAAELALQQQRDSLTRIIEQKDNEIDDMMATMNDIQEGFRAINEAEQRVTIASNGEGVSEAESIRENMQFIQPVFQEGTLDHQKDEVIESPEDKVPARAMPESGQRPDSKGVENIPRQRAAVASQRDIYIIPEPG